MIRSSVSATADVSLIPRKYDARECAFSRWLLFRAFPAAAVVMLVHA